MRGWKYVRVFSLDLLRRGCNIAACTLLALLLVSPVAAQQDINITSTGAYADLGRGLAWANSGVGGMNNNYLFTPQDSNEGVCVYVYNNDSSSHNFTLQAFQSGDQRITSYKGNTSKWIGTGQTGATFLTISATFQLATFFQVASAAKVAVVISGGSGAGTADVFLVQSQKAGCGNGSTQFSPTTDVAGYISYFGSNAITGTQCTVNPPINGDLLNINAAGSVPFQAFYLRWLRISTTVASQFNVLRTTAVGSTCSATSALNTNLSITTFSGSSVTTGCTTPPTNGGTISSVLVGASSPYLVDLGNIVWIPTTASFFGIEVTNPVAITGTVCVDFLYSQQ